MRKCIRCDSNMIEGLNVGMPVKMVSIELKQSNLVKTPIAPIKASLCPKCGYLEMYVELDGKTEELQNFLLKENCHLS